MSININDYITKLPRKRRDKIETRSQELLAEVENLQELRKVLRHSQIKMAKKLHVNQAAVSKIERRPDMYVSTLRDFIEAMGGSLEIIAQFPNSTPVKINQFTGIE